jgi:flagellar motility protein MotE (MotC chaperone)
VKKLFGVLVLTLAMNFLAAAGAIGWLFQSGHLDRPRVKAIKEVVFPATQPAAPTTQPAAQEEPPTGSKRLEELLTKTVGNRTAADQVEFIRQRYDQSMAQLDIRQRQIEDLERQVSEGNRKLVEDRKALEAERQQLADRQKQVDRLASDKGFQDTLSLYTSMQSKQTKTIFMTLDDQSVADYLDAMEPGTASKIIKEFKTPQETQRIQRVLEKMHHPQQAVQASAAPATNSKE